MDDTEAAAPYLEAPSSLWPACQEALAHELPDQQLCVCGSNLILDEKVLFQELRQRDELLFLL